MDVYYAQKITKYVQNPEVDIRIHPNFEARRNRTSKINVLAKFASHHSSVTARSAQLSTRLPVINSWAGSHGKSHCSEHVVVVPITAAAAVSCLSHCLSLRTEVGVAWISRWPEYRCGASS